ncbi:MAG: ABC transporter permease [Acidobacteriota bacterium]
MHGFLAVFSRELRAYFVSPLAWVILTFFLLVQGYVFSLIVGFLTDPRAVAGPTPFEIFFGGIFLWLTLVFVTPVITMRLISEERRSGTIEALMTAPVTAVQVVLAKFFAAFVFYAFLWLPTLAYPALLSRDTSVDWGPILAGYLGVLGIGGMFLSVGIFGSSFSKNQIVSAVVTFGCLMLLLFLPWAGSLTQDPQTGELLGYMNLLDHMDELGQGIVDSRRLVYYLTTAALFLFLSSRALEAKKWR